MKQAKVALAPLADPRYDTALAQEVTRSLRTRLIFNGIKVVGDYSLITSREAAAERTSQLAAQSFDLLLLLQATFADSALVTTMAQGVDRPLLLWGVPEPDAGEEEPVRLNSLSGLSQATWLLGRRNIVYHHAYAPIADRAAIDHVKQVAAAASVVLRLRREGFGPHELTSYVDDEQGPIGCQGDVGARVSQLILESLSDRSTYGVHLFSADLDQNEVLLCPCPDSTPEIAGPPWKPGRVTLGRLSRAGGVLRLGIAGGEVLSRSPSFRGVSAAVRFDRPLRQFLQRVLDEGLEQHLALTYGDHQASLTALAKILGIPLLRL